MLRVHDPLLPSAGLLRLPVAGGNHVRLEVREQQQIGPFLDQRAHVLFVQLQREPVIAAKLVRLLELLDLRVGRHDDVDALVLQPVQRVQQLHEPVLDQHIAFPVWDLLHAANLLFLADVPDRELLRPVQGVNGERSQFIRVVDEPVHLTHEILPVLRRIRPGHVHVDRAVLRVDEHDARELGRERALADALRAVDDDLQRRLFLASGNVHHLITTLSVSSSSAPGI